MTEHDQNAEQTTDTNPESEQRAVATPEPAGEGDEAAPREAGAPDEEQPGRKRRRRRRRRKKQSSGEEATQTQESGQSEDAQQEASSGSGESGPGRKSGSRKRGSGKQPAPEGDDRARESARDPAQDEEAIGEEEAARPRPAPAPVDADDPDLFDLEHGFAQLGLNPEIVERVESAGFKRPTLIQSQLIPPALEGKDLLGQAKTGTGKTAAFGLPILQMVEPGEPNQALVLAPTRELANQIADGMRLLASGSSIRIVPIYGGQSIKAQADKLKRKPEVIVATPGRVQDMVERGYLSFDNFRFVVLDEVDRMLDIGFRDDVRRILRKCPKERQTMMVSATIDGEIEDLARRFMRDPEKIITSSGSLTVKLVEQHYFSINPWDKKRLLIHLLKRETPGLTLVFCRLKRVVDDLAARVSRENIPAVAIHGDMRQTQRDKVIKRLRAGELGVVIASDLAARGLDVEGITHVVNYDLPEDPEVYVHRIGRTARAGRTGVAWSFVTPEQGKLLTEIEKLIDTHIPQMEYPDFEPGERPANWREAGPGGQPTIDIDAVPVRSRFSPAGLPPGDPRRRTTEDERKVEEKFPGGVVPTRMPQKRLGGKVRTARSNKVEEWSEKRDA